MTDSNRISNILDSAERARVRTSTWSLTKQEFARKSTHAVIEPFPASSDVGPKQLVEDNSSIRDTASVKEK